MKCNLEAQLSSTKGGMAIIASVLLLFLALPGGGGLWPLLGVAVVPFLFAILKGSRRQALFLTLLFGVAHFLVQLYWIVFVIGHYGGLPLYLSIPALLLLCVYLTLYLLLFTLIVRGSVAHFSPFVSVWLIPAIWVSGDYLRSFVLSGFPWMDLGYGLIDVSLLAQSADIWGHSGLSFLIILVNAAVTLLLLAGREKKQLRNMVLPVLSLLAFVSLYSLWRMNGLEDELSETDSLNVGIVQGNIDQGQKWNPSLQGATVATYLEQSRFLMDTAERPDLLLWPETALPFYPQGHPLLLPIARFLQEQQVMLLTGSPWYDEESLEKGTLQLYNASLLFDSQGAIVKRTAKSHLVPFGEYVPYKKYLPFIAPLVEGVGDFIPGEVADPPSCKNAKIGVLICFESIFPDISRKWVKTGANLLVNITNDAWYGKSSAPHQTLAMTRMRAIETRRSIVRSANTGFSAFIDPLGRMGDISPLFEKWQAGKKAALMEEQTLFVRGGFAFPQLCLILSVIVSIVLVGKRRTYKEKSIL